MELKQDTNSIFARLLPAVLAAILLPLAATAQSSQGTIFGNNPGNGNTFSFIADGGIASGGAVAFTPTENLSFSGITVWLNGYTGKDIYGHSNQSFYAGIYTSVTAYPGATPQPFQEVDTLTCPTANNGSSAAFTFANSSPSFTLQANTEYWVFIYENTGGSYNYTAAPEWVAGSTPLGDAVYNGAESFSAGTFTASSETPSFAIDGVNSTMSAVNAVPEPGTTSMMVLSLASVGLYAYRRKKA